MATQIPSTVPYAFPHSSTLHPSTTALVVIDMQRDFLHPGGYLSSAGYSITRFSDLIPRLFSLLSTFRNAGFYVVHTREGHEAHLRTVSSREFGSRVCDARFQIGAPGFQSSDLRSQISDTGVEDSPSEHRIAVPARKSRI